MREVSYLNAMEKARQMLLKGKSVTEVSDGLGFEYPQHFSRMFKKEFGTVPSKMNTDSGPKLR